MQQSIREQWRKAFGLARVLHFERRTARQCGSICLANDVPVLLGIKAREVIKARLPDQLIAGVSVRAFIRHYERRPIIAMDRDRITVMALQSYAAERREAFFYPRAAL